MYLMVRNQGRRNWIERQTGDICPRIAKQLEKLKDASAFCFSSYAGGRKFQVKEVEGEQFAVDIGDRTCTCRKWDISGIPCKHGITALSLEGMKPEDYVDECYSVAAYKCAYEPIVCPCNGPNNWPKTGFPPVLPPPKLILPRRPKTKRKLEDGEKKKVEE